MGLVLLGPATGGLGFNDARPVLAYYYALWDPGNFDQTLFQPDAAYNSDDMGVLQRHVQQAQSAGIDGFVLSWHGNGDRTDSNLAHMLDIGQSSGFRATIHFETPLFYGADDVVAQLQALYQNRVPHPAFVRLPGSTSHLLLAGLRLQHGDLEHHSQPGGPGAHLGVDRRRPRFRDPGERRLGRHQPLRRRLVGQSRRSAANLGGARRRGGAGQTVHSAGLAQGATIRTSGRRPACATATTGPTTRRRGTAPSRRIRRGRSSSARTTSGWNPRRSSQPSSTATSTCG